MTEKEITLKEVTETGFYCFVDDTERYYIYEVINNTDKEWLKENPKAALLIDEWIYDYTDYDNRRVYGTSGNLVVTYLNTSTHKVYKIEDTKYKVYGNCGQFLIEDKLTYKEQLARKEQELKNEKEAARIDLEVLNKACFDLKNELEEREQECEHYKLCFEQSTENNKLAAKTIISLQVENEELKEKFKNLFDIDNQDCWDLAFLKDENAKYKQALEEINNITQKYNVGVGDTIIANPIQDCFDIFQKINEVLKDESEVENE